MKKLQIRKENENLCRMVSYKGTKKRSEIDFIKTNKPGLKNCFFRSLYAVYRYGRGNDTYRFSRSGGCSYFHRSWSWWLRSWCGGKWLTGKKFNIGYRIENERYAERTVRGTYY